MVFFDSLFIFIFWISILFFSHTWLFYPLGLFLALKWRSRRGIEKKKHSDMRLPSVSVVIPVHNAEKKVKKKILDTLALDYPIQRLEIVVVSDGSTDYTVEEARMIADRRVKVFNLNPNQGKSAAQNFGVKQATNEIIVFTDVDSILDRNFIRNIVQYFANSEVACVGGTALLMTQDGHVAKSQGLYWYIEQFLRQAESALGMLHSLPGWGFAIRRSDFTPLDHDTGDDMVLPLEMALRRKKNVIALDAFVSDSMPSNVQGELKARQRITLRNLTGLMRRSALLNPFHFPRMSFAIWSHKLLRWLSPVFLILMFVSSSWLYLYDRNQLYGYLFVSQIIIYGLGISGFVASLKSLRIPLGGFISSFFIANIGFFLGLIKYLTGQKIKSYKNQL